MSEAQRVQQIMEDIANGAGSARKLKYDRRTKTLRPSSSYDDPDDVTPLTHQDMDLYAADDNSSEIVTVSGEYVESIVGKDGSHDAWFSSMDGGTVYTMLGTGGPDSGVRATVHVVDDFESQDVLRIGKSQDMVRMFIKRGRSEPTVGNEGCETKKPQQVKGYVLKEGTWKPVPVEVVPVRAELFSRFIGLLETDVLSGKEVFVIGLGSGGSGITVGLAQSGIMNFTLMDHDRLEVCNVARHVAGISHVGRYKVDVMKDIIHEKNPHASVCTLRERVCWENMESLRKRVKRADAVVCAADDRVPKRIFNRLCIQEETVLIIAGAFRRAYGGQVLRVRPKESLCFQCFLSSLPHQAQDQEVSSAEQAQRLAYTDRPVPIEPGLANDIAPINQLVVKLVIQELLRGRETSLKSLDEDLVAPLYLWLNRREQGTDYSKLQPLEYNVDGMSVLRWYGIDIPRDPACPECGDFIGEMSRQLEMSGPEADSETLGASMEAN